MVNLKDCRSVRSRKIRSGNIITYDLRLDTNEMKLVTHRMVRDIEACGDIITARNLAMSIARQCGIVDLKKVQSIIVTRSDNRTKRKYSFIIMKPVDTIQTIEVIIN